MKVIQEIKEYGVKVIMLKNKKREIRNCLVAILSSAFLAFGLYHVHSLSGVTEGGVLGMTLVWNFTGFFRLCYECIVLLSGLEINGKRVFRIFHCCYCKFFYFL